MMEHVPLDPEVHPAPPGMNCGRPPKYDWPFRRMEVGQSFTIGEDLAGNVSILASALTRFDSGGRRYVTRRLSKGKWRCYRVA